MSIRTFIVWIHKTQKQCMKSPSPHFTFGSPQPSLCFPPTQSQHKIMREEPHPSLHIEKPPPSMVLLSEKKQNTKTMREEPHPSLHSGKPPPSMVLPSEIMLSTCSMSTCCMSTCCMNTCWMKTCSVPRFCLRSALTVEQTRDNCVGTAPYWGACAIMETTSNLANNHKLNKLSKRIAKVPTAPSKDNPCCGVSFCLRCRSKRERANTNTNSMKQAKPTDINKPSNHASNHATNQPTNQPTNQATKQPTNQPTN